ncbi:hypothetical protein [Bacteroides intestinalis]|jgi:hypothetical protein|uniref:hypothetical protein n=1 Tax=Bacteroides intestinalis TaxID=329854 RepID=UPI0022E44FA5|nr:hypothetical protein [Bacteroides intestinalis]
MNKHFYLKHEIMSFNDPRIQNMISREGGKAYGTYWYILEKLSFLPDMEADMKYLKPFATRNFTYPYMMKIVTDFQLFTIVGDHFSPVQLNTKYVEEPQKKEENVEVKPTKNTAKNSGQNGKKYPDNDVKSGKNDGFSTKNRQTMDKNRDGNESGAICNSQNNSGLSENSIQHKENIRDIITTAAKEKEISAVAATVNHSGIYVAADTAIFPFSGSSFFPAICLRQPSCELPYRQRGASPPGRQCYLEQSHEAMDSSPTSGKTASRDGEIRPVMRRNPPREMGQSCFVGR